MTRARSAEPPTIDGSWYCCYEVDVGAGPVSSTGPGAAVSLLVGFDANARRASTIAAGDTFWGQVTALSGQRGRVKEGVRDTGKMA
jgi:hypothetical protein